MSLNRLLNKIVLSFPGKETFGRYRFLPVFFFLGAGLEYVMIKWTPGGYNFYKTYTKRQIEKQAQKQVHFEDLREYVKAEQEKQKQALGKQGFEEKVAIRVEEIKRERNELLYGDRDKKEVN